MKTRSELQTSVQAFLTRIKCEKQEPSGLSEGPCGNFASVVCLRCDRCWCGTKKTTHTP